MTREQEEFLSAKNGSIRWKDAKEEWWEDPEFVLKAVSRRSSLLELASEKLIQNKEFMLDTISQNPEVLSNSDLFAYHFRDEDFVIAVGERVKNYLRSLIPDCDISDKKFDDIKLAIEYKIKRFEENKLEIKRVIDEQDKLNSNGEKNYSDERKAELERIISKI